MTRILAVVTLAIMISTAAEAKDNALARARAMAAIGSNNLDRGYYEDPDPFRLNHPQYNVIGGVNPLSKGGSRNRNRTTFTDADGSTTKVTEWTDFRGEKHIIVEEY